MVALASALRWALLWAALGAVGATLAGPALLSWWYAPPVGAGLDCAPAVDWALSNLVQVQAMATGGTAVLGFAAGLVRAWRARKAPVEPELPRAT